MCLRMAKNWREINEDSELTSGVMAANHVRAVEGVSNYVKQIY